MTTRRWFPICLGLAALATLASPALAQAPPSDAVPPPATTPGPSDLQPAAQDSTVAVPMTASDLNRIRRALDMDPALRIDDSQLRFYMQILARQPTFAEFAKGYDFRYGPTRGGNPMTHSEFLAMVTPRELHSQIGIDARETLEFALTNWLGQTLVKRAFADLQKARTEREIQDIRDRIERELALLKGAAER